MSLESWVWDVRLACREAARRPGFTVLLTATLALGIGVNSAVFALVDAVLLRPLPYRDPSQLVFVWQTLPKLGVPELEATPFDYDVWRTARTLSDVTMIKYDSFTLTGGDEPERVAGARVTASLMPTLGLSPMLGRPFAAAEDLDAVPAVAILGNGLWRRRFGGDPTVVGRMIHVDGEPTTVVGIMASGASLPGSQAGDDGLWLPARMTPGERALDNKHSYTVVARLRTGVGIAQAFAELDAIARRLAAERLSHKDIGVRLVPMAEQTVRAIRPALVVAVGAVALLLVIAAANAATLLLARRSHRRHELAMRAALGATRRRLLSQSIAESFVYASLGAVVGFLLGTWALRGLLPLFAGSLPGSAAVGATARTGLFTAALSFGLVIVFGAAVGVRGMDRLHDALATSRRSTAAPATNRRRTALVVVQVALAVVLLSAGGLLVSSVVRLSAVGPGFDADRVLTFKVGLTGPRYAAAPARVAFVSDLVARLAASVGVQATGVTSLIPFGGMRGANAVEIENRPQGAGEPPIVVDQRHVSPGYFAAMGTPLVTGRVFNAGDNSRAERVTVINRTMASRYFPGANAVNRRVRTTAGFDSNVWFRIVGVVEDVRHISLVRDAVPEMYHPIAQTAVPAFTVAVRAAGNPAALGSVARAAVRAVDADVPISDVRTMAERVAGSFAKTRAAMFLLVATAALAALLSAIAIYGSIWYSVTQRVAEIGIRLALGATSGSIFVRVMRGAVIAAALGGALGAGISSMSGALLGSLLFETRTTDVWIHGAVVAGVIVLAAAASFVPAMRAMRIDPIEALRAD